MNFSTSPRILLEGFPLTLKRGTGIFNYSLHLLASLNEISLSDIGLILLFEDRIKYSRQFNSQKPLTQLQGYARLMGSLYRNREGLQDDTWLLERPFSKLLPSQLSGVAAMLELLIQNFKLIEIPAHFKPSILEIIAKSDDSFYKFIINKKFYLTNF